MAKKKPAKKDVKYPFIDFIFSGFVRDAVIKEVMDIRTSRTVSCANVPAATLVKNLRSGRWAIDFVKVYSDSCDVECEIAEYEESWENEEADE